LRNRDAEGKRASEVSKTFETNRAGSSFASVVRAAMAVSTQPT
jgi:hypothetical protein